MKFLCVTSNLTRVLNSIERFTGKNTALPILGNTLLEVENNTLRITATNLESAIQTTIYGNGQRSGKVSVSAKVLSSLLQSVPEEKVQLEERQGNLLVKTSTRESRVNGLAVDDFPLIPNVKNVSSFTITGSALKKGLAHVVPAISLSEFKPELNGVYIQNTSNYLRFAATDTFRLAEYVINREGSGQEQSFSFILPGRIAQELVRVVDDEEEVNVRVGENQFLCESDSLRVISRLTDGNFPDYAAIIPKNFTTSFFIKKNDLIHSVKTSGIFASKLQDVTLKVGNKAIEIASLNQDIGEYKSTLACAPSGEEMKVGYNYRYLLDGLNSLNEEEIFFGMNGEQAPSLLKNKADGSFVYVLMPIRLT